MKRRILSIFLCFCMIFGCLSFVACSCKDASQQEESIDPDDSGGETPDDSGGDTPQVSAWQVTMNHDDHVLVRVYETQDDMAKGKDGVNVEMAYTRDADGVITKREAQLNFQLIFEDGYELDYIEVTHGTYYDFRTFSNYKYRVLRISADTEVVVRSKEDTYQTPVLYDEPVEIKSVYNNEEYFLTITPQNNSTFGYKNTGNILHLFSLEDCELSLSGCYYGGVLIDADSNIKFVLNFEGFDIYAIQDTPALYVYQAKNVEISVKKETTNAIITLRINHYFFMSKI